MTVEALERTLRDAARGANYAAIRTSRSMRPVHVLGGVPLNTKKPLAAMLLAAALVMSAIATTTATAKPAKPPPAPTSRSAS